MKSLLTCRTGTMLANWSTNYFFLHWYPYNISTKIIIFFSYIRCSILYKKSSYASLLTDKIFSYKNNNTSILSLSILKSDLSKTVPASAYRIFIVLDQADLCTKYVSYDIDSREHCVGNYMIRSSRYYFADRQELHREVK